MRFDNLKERMEYLRSIEDFKLIPGQPVMVMIDGHSFSSKIKKRFKRPFDKVFIDAMNKTAEYICENVQGCKLAYVQSDEISFVLTDYDTLLSDSYFGYRLCKIQSIIPSLAAAKFNQLMISYYVSSKELSDKDASQLILDAPLYDFDCKVWNVPTENDVFAWFLYRQNDCIRNSKNQVAQTVLSHSQLIGKNTDEAVEMAKNAGLDWNTFSNGEKYGRFIFQHDIEVKDGVVRKKWKSEDAFPLFEDPEKSKEQFKSITGLVNL